MCTFLETGQDTNISVWKQQKGSLNPHSTGKKEKDPEAECSSGWRCQLRSGSRQSGTKLIGVSELRV